MLEFLILGELKQSAVVLWTHLTPNRETSRLELTLCNNDFLLFESGLEYGVLPDLIDFLLEGPVEGFSILYVLVSDYIPMKKLFLIQAVLSFRFA